MAELIKEETIFMKEEILPTSTEENVCTVYVQEDVVKKKEFEIKEEISPSTVEDTCTLYVKEEDVKIENIGDQGSNYLNIFSYKNMYFTQTDVVALPFTNYHFKSKGNVKYLGLLYRMIFFNFSLNWKRD